MTADGNTAARRRPHRFAPGQRSARRQAHEVSHDVRPVYIRWVLANPRAARHRFTDWQWQILVLRYPACETCGATHEINGPRFVNKILGMAGKSHKVRKAEYRAHAIAVELYFDWRPANEKWHRIRAGSDEELTPQERAVLARNRPDRKKKGRRVVERIVERTQPADVYMLNADDPRKPIRRGHIIREGERDRFPLPFYVLEENAAADQVEDDGDDPRRQ